MADTNTDGSKASAGQKFYNFAANGGGTITFRIVVPLLLTVLGFLINGMWTELRDGQKDIAKVVTDQGKSIVGNSTRLDGMATGQRLIWTKLGAHDALIEDARDRVTRLESCQPNCAPR